MSVLVILEQRGALKTCGLEAASAAKKVAESAGMPLNALYIGQSLDDDLPALAGLGISTVYAYEHGDLRYYANERCIQAMDLLGRKVPTGGDTSVRYLMKAMGKDITESGEMEALKPIADKVQEVQNEVIAAIMHLSQIGLSGEIEKYISNASPFLEMFSQMVLSWQLLRQAVVAQRALDAGTRETDFYTSKIETARFYVNTVTPHAVATARILTSDETTALDFKAEWF